MKSLTALCLALGLSAALPAAARCTQPDTAKALMAQAQSQVDAYRRAAGLGPLSNNTALSKTAQAHACDMAAMGKWSHTGRNGSGIADRLKASGYRFRAANENVGKFGKTNAVQWWYQSPSHRSNILSRKIKEVGFGVALGPDNQLYWVMVGGARK